MVEIINDQTIQVFKDVLLNDLGSDNDLPNRIASDYGISRDEYVMTFPHMLAASLNIKSGKVVLCSEAMEQLDVECYREMLSNKLDSVTIDTNEYNKIIDTVGIEKMASIVGDSVKFYNWYRTSDDKDLEILKCSEDYSGDVVIDDENPFMGYEKSDL